MAGGVTDSRPRALRQGYHQLFDALTYPCGAEELEKDVLGLTFEQMDLDVSGLPSGTARDLRNAVELETSGRLNVIGTWVRRVSVRTAEAGVREALTGSRLDGFGLGEAPAS